MARSRLGRALAITHVVLGFSFVALATLAAFVLAEPHTGFTAAWVIAAVVTLALPIALAVALMRNVRALRSRSSYVRTTLYAIELLSVIALVLLFTLARVPTARALEGVPSRFPHAGSVPLGAARLLARWIGPNAAAGGMRAATTPGGRDAGARVNDAAAEDVLTAVRPESVDADVALDAGAAEASTADAMPEAGSTENAVLDAAVPLDTGGENSSAVLDAGAAPDAGESAPDAAATANAGNGDLVHVCDRALSVFPADLGHEPVDELVVGCSDGVRALWSQPGGLVERTLVAPRAPAGDSVVVREPRVSDVNDDGRADLLVCAHWTAPSGDVAGGGLYLLAGGENGQFLAPTTVIAQPCGAADVGDVDGDGRPDIVVALEGNPNSPTRPNGELVWLQRVGARWNARGRTPLRRDPLRMWLADANNDGIVDVAVQHGGPGDGATVNPGSRRGPLPIDILLHVPPAPERLHEVPARLDDDATADAVSAEGGELRLRRSARDNSGALANRTSRALDWTQFNPPSP